MNGVDLEEGHQIENREFFFFRGEHARLRPHQPRGGKKSKEPETSNQIAQEAGVTGQTALSANQIKGKGNPSPTNHV